MRVVVKYIVTIVVMLVLIALYSYLQDWVKANYPPLQPYCSIAMGIVLGIGAAFNMLPGQPDEPSSTLVKLITFFAMVVSTFLFFGVADMIKTNYPGWFVPFRISVIALITGAYYRTLRSS
jgi:predicted MFS family arabinose efflux permease